MANRTFSAPQAFIKIDNEVDGYIRSISWNENISRANVQGLGRLWATERPATAASGTFTIDKMFISLDDDATKRYLNRSGGAQALIDTLTMGETGFSIYIFKKEIVSIDSTTKLVTEINPSGVEVAVISTCYLESQSFSLSEGGIAGFNLSGSYISPVVLNP